MTLASPHLMAWALAAVALVLWWRHRRRGRAGPPAIDFSSVADLSAVLPPRRHPSGPVILGLQVLALLGLALSLGRPRVGHLVREILTPGVDIAVVLDLSDSMRAEDMGPSVSRFDAARKVVHGFIDGRNQDRIGLVVFAAQAFTQCPLTLDYPLLHGLVDGLSVGSIRANATAIGMGIVTALARLKDSPARSRVIILVTDGRSNTGSIDPITAADLAKGVGVKIYTVGVGGRGPAPFPMGRDPLTQRVVYGQIPDDLNEEDLQKVAQVTGGTYRRATSPEALASIFTEISTMEKTEVKAKTYTLYEELFTWLLWPALLAMALELVLSSTVWRRIP